VVCSKIDLPPLDGPSEERGARQQIQLSLDSALPDAGLANDLAQVEGFIRVPQQPPQDTPSCAAKEHGCGLAMACLHALSWRTHFEYICTHLGYISQESNIRR